MPPSALSPLGPVRHLAEVGRAWSRRVFEDDDAPMVRSGGTGFQAACDAGAPAGDEAFAARAAEVENSRLSGGRRSPWTGRRVPAPRG